MPDVLIVDDDPRVRALLELALLTNGYTVREAADGFEALLEMAQDPPDAVVMDLSMPRIGGLEVLEALHGRGLTGEVPVVVHTGEDDPTLVERAASLGIAEYFLKPVDPETVVEALGEHLLADPADLATVTSIARSPAGAGADAAAG